MRYFGKLYLDKEKDIVVTLGMDKSVLSYTIHVENHQSDNLINNLAAISGQLTTVRDGKTVIEGQIPCYIKGDGQRVYIFRLNGTKLANIYPDGKIADRDQIKPEHFQPWVDYAKARGLGLDFNPTYFSHPKAAESLTLSHPDDEIRAFWVRHGIACRKIAQ